MEKTDNSIKKEPSKPIKAKPAVFGMNLWMGVICLLTGFLLNVNTIGFDYVLDDHSVISENPYVMQGVKGIGNIFSMDLWQFRGTRLGYYRPLSLVSFAIENQFFPQNPHVSHLDNALLYGITGFVLCLLLIRIFSSFDPLFSFVVTLLFIAHPIHTEVVANIKSRDEILSFLNLILAIYFLLKSIDQKGNFRLAILSYLFFYLALLSKETALSGLFIIPLILYFISNNAPAKSKVIKAKISVKKILMLTAPFLAVTLLFELQKYATIGSGADLESRDIVNYPYLVTDSRLPSAFLIFFRCIKLVLLPYPLSYNYAYNQIPPAEWSTSGTIAGLLIAFLLTYFLLRGLKTKSAIDLGVFLFTTTLAPAMAFVLLKGGILAERFLYAPVLGFAIVLSFWGFKISGLLAEGKNTSGILNRSNLKRALPFFLVFVIYSTLTVARNTAWKDNMTLFSHDSKVSTNSCQVHYHYGLELATLGNAEQDSIKKRKIYESAVSQLYQCIAINPHDADAFLLMGYAYQNVMINYDSAYHYYNKAIEIAPRFPMGYNNLGVLFESLGYQDYASYYYNKSVEVDPNYIDGVNNHERHLKATRLNVKVLPGVIGK